MQAIPAWEKTGIREERGIKEDVKGRNGWGSEPCGPSISGN